MIRRTYQRVRVTLVRERTPEPYGQPPAIKHSGDVAELLRQVIGSDPREMIAAVYLNSKHKVIGLHECGIGTLDQALVHPREIFGPALTMGASALVLAHNHPSGDPTPSEQDNAVTKRARECGELLGIAMLDHIVIGESRFYSFADEAFSQFNHVNHAK